MLISLLYPIFRFLKKRNALTPVINALYQKSPFCYQESSEIFQYLRIGADHFALIHSCPPDVKSWTTFFTNFYFRSASTPRRKSLIFLDIPPFFSLAVYFFALIFIFTADDLGSSPFSIIKDSSFNLFLCCAISLQDSISIFSKNPAYLWFFHQKQKFDPTCHQQPEKIGVKNALRFLLKKTKILNFRASDTLFPLHHVLC